MALRLSEAFNEGFLLDDAGFLLRHVPDAHLQFCLSRHHGVSLRMGRMITGESTARQFANSIPCNSGHL